MQNGINKPGPVRTGKKTGIWLAWSVAIGLHAIILLLPLTKQVQTSEDAAAQIEVELVKISPPAPTPQALVPEPEPLPPEPEPKTPAISEPADTIADMQVEKEAIKLEDKLLAPQPPLQRPDPANMTALERSRLTDTILARQYINQEPVIDQVFGKPLQQQDPSPQKSFYFPLRQNMITMLNRPMQELPFAYTPELVRFAYDPGVKGELQRFWDFITPEFGWTTKNGTEFRCKWILVIGGCGWKYDAYKISVHRYNFLNERRILRQQTGRR